MGDTSEKAKSAIRNKTYHYLDKNNKIIPHCQVCGFHITECHHLDYVDPYKAVFVCIRCHKKIHSGCIVCPEPIDVMKLPSKSIKEMRKERVDEFSSYPFKLKAIPRVFQEIMYKEVTYKECLKYKKILNETGVIKVESGKVAVGIWPKKQVIDFVRNNVI